MNNYKFQILGLLVIGILFINYCRDRKLPLMSTRIFTIFMIFAASNIVFDGLTVYTITHLDSVPAVLNRFVHQVYIWTLNSLLYCLYFYVLILSENQKRISTKQLILRSIPYGVSVIAIIVAPLRYYVSETAFYSYGLMADTVYICVVIYILMVAGNIIKASNRMNLYKKVLICAGMSVWVIIACIQLYNPEKLLTTIGVVAMVLMVYLSIENPREYVDTEIGCFNRGAFHLMSGEIIAAGSRTYLINVVLEDIEYINNALGYTEADKILTKTARVISRTTSQRIYHSRGNMLSIFSTQSGVAMKIKDLAEDGFFEHQYGVGVCYRPKYHIDIIECPKFASNEEELYEVIDYLNKEYNRTDYITVITEEIINQKKKYKAIEELIEKAVQEKAFDVFYQPIYSNETGAFSSAEALVRLKDNKTLGFISPEIFIPIAEKKGIIGELGNIVFEKVCQFMSSENIHELGVHYIEVNLSGLQVVDKGIVRTLTFYMNKYNIKPEWINLEITETAAINAKDILAENMQKLRDIGCHFSMDDFGTGYSNLSHMANSKFELIKLDKRLIWPCFKENGEDARIILDNCISMLLKLGTKIVAEGVETKEQADLLTQKGVTYLQGYYFSRPICEKDYLVFLKNN